MKKVFLVAALSLGTMTAFAQEETAVEAIATEVQEEAAEEMAIEAIEAVEETSPEAVQEEAVEAMEVQDAFAEIAVEEVPEAVTEALNKAHPEATISKAFINEAAQYKLEVATDDDTTVELYADAEGNWIEM